MSGTSKPADRILLTASSELLPAIEDERIAEAQESRLILSRHQLVNLLLSEALEARRRRRTQSIAA